MSYAHAWACRSSTAWPARFPPAWTPRAAATFVGNLRFAAAALKHGQAAPADRGPSTLRHSGLLPEPHGSGDCHPRRWAPTTPSCGTTSTTPSAWRGERCHAAKNLARIAHVQLADNPGRNRARRRRDQLTPFLFAHLDRIGYAGWVGCEYNRPGYHRGPAWAGWKNWREKGLTPA